MALPSGPVNGFSGASATSPSNVADAATLSGLADSVSFVRDFWPTLLDRYPDRQLIENGLMAHLVDNKAFVGVQTNTTQLFHAEQESVLNTLSVVNMVNVSGATATLVVNAITYGPTPNYYAYATVGQNFQVADSPALVLNVTGVGAVGAAFGGATPTSTQFAITVVASSDVTLTGLVSAGDTLLPQDAVNDPNGDFPNGTVRGWSRFGLYFQYMSTGSAIVGQDTYNQSFMFQLEGGQTILAPRIFADAMMTAMLRKSAAITRGRGEEYGNKRTTVGFVSAAQAYGLTDDYAAGGVQMSDLEDIGIRLQNRGAGTELDLWGGYAFMQSIQRNALSPLTGGAVQYISGEMNDGNGRPGLKKSLGHFILGKFKVNLNEASEWAHKAMYSPDLGGTSLADGYWANAFCIIPKEQVAVPRELTNTSFTVTAPMFRVLQLKAPATTGGTPVMNQIIKRDPAHFGAMKYQIVNNENFAAQTMLATKLYFGGTII